MTLMLSLSLKQCVMAFGLLLGGLASAFAQNLTDEQKRELAAYRVPEKNVFEQITLTPSVIDQLIAVTPEVNRSHAELGKKMLEISQSDRSTWDKSVAQVALRKKHDQELIAILKKGGFSDFKTYSQAIGSMSLIVMPDEVQKNGYRSIEIIKHYKTLPPALVPVLALANFEMQISVAQQKPLSANLALVEPRKLEIIEKISRNDDLN
jgi:hypothetical protein